MSSPLLFLFVQVDPTATALATVAATTDAYAFWLAVIDRLLPILMPLATAVGAYILYLTRRDVSETRTKLGQVHDQLNGRMTELVEAQRAAAHAEGKLEGVTETAPQVAQSLTPPPAVPPVQVQVAFDPDARPGGKRRLDPPGLPASPPAEVDPSSHQP